MQVPGYYQKQQDEGGSLMTTQALNPGSEKTALGKISLNGREVSYYPGESLLETARREGIDIPSFCYHSELSVYGACRLCLVEVAGRGLMASCSTKPENGMQVVTDNPKLLQMRRTILELLLANHKLDCPTCPKGTACRLQELCQRMGLREARYGQRQEDLALDTSGPAVVRDPNKCILCGDCVRMCREVQGLGVLDFAFRGSRTVVLPAFGKNLAEVDCVHCGQCASVCPTAAITVRSEVDRVWEALQDPDTFVVAQLAPAVRVSLGEEFGLSPGEDGTGLLVAALKRLGFDRVYDTVFSADLTTVEETHEFKERLGHGGPFPHLTSCCPAWVKYTEQYFPDYIPNISTCKSPQQMLGALVKELPKADLGAGEKKVMMVSFMPCTAKKFEAQRPEHAGQAGPHVDVVLSTIEAAQLVRQGGIVFAELEPEACDNPLGMTTGAGVIFGASGGVTEAVLRLALEEAGLPQPPGFTFKELASEDRVKTAEIPLGDLTLKVAIVSGLKAAGELLKSVREGNASYHLIEVMACPGGCVGGGGQPCQVEGTRGLRKKGLYRIDRAMQLRIASHNPFIKEMYQRYLGKPGSEEAHHLLHTTYNPRRRMPGSTVHPILEAKAGALEVSVCVGTGCFLRGAHGVLENLLQGIRQANLDRQVSISATFCLEHCDQGVSLRIGDQLVTGVTPAGVKDLIENSVRPQLK
jgi:NADH-quinone oxidoreductase subunit G